MLTTLQNLQFVLCTGYGNSEEYAGGDMGSSIFAIKFKACVRAMVHILLFGQLSVFQ
jgi:hypothetical protein